MKKIIGMLWVLGFAVAANASVSISTVSPSSEYGITGAEVAGFRSTGVAKTYDGDGDNAYGTAGYVVFGGANSDSKGQAWDGANTILSNPSFGTFAAGGNFDSVSRLTTYPKYDDPSLAISADVVDLGATAIVLTTAGTAGSWNEIVTFTIDTNTPASFRVGIMAGNEMSDDGRWAPTGLGLSFDGGTATTVTSLDIITGNTGMVFFDVFVTEESTGVISILAQKRLDTQGPSLAGVTIDEIVVPDGATLIFVPNALSLALNVPDTSTNGIITASYRAGAVTSNDIEIVSLVASNGFSASSIPDLGTGNLTEDITVTFTNSLGLANGESTNATLVVTWTELNSGVTNTSEAALDVTYFDEPSSLVLVPTSISLTLNAGDASTNGTITASFVEGTLGKNVEVVSVTASNGFSATPGTFILSVGSTNEDITVIFTNPGDLAHEEVVDSTLVVSWTETGSGVTNTTDVALDVVYSDPPVTTAGDVIAIDFGNTATTVSNWNTSVIATTTGLVRLSDGASTAVDLTITSVGGTPENNTTFEDGSAQGGSSVFEIYDDAMALLGAGDDEITLTFTGLNDSLTYNLFAGGKAGGNGFGANWDISTSAAGGTNQKTEYQDTVGYVSFTGITSVGGTFALTINDISDAGGGSAGRNIGIAELTLTAFDESENGDVSIGVISGNVVLSWEGGGSYNVETNANLVLPNWGVLESSATSPTTNAIGSEAQLFYKLSE